MGGEMKSSCWVPIRLDVSSEPQQRIIDTVLIDTSVEPWPDPSQLAFALVADALVHPMVRNGRQHFTGRLDSSHLPTLWKQGTKQLEEQFRAIRHHHHSAAAVKAKQQTTSNDQPAVPAPSADGGPAASESRKRERSEDEDHPNVDRSPEAAATKKQKLNDSSSSAQQQQQQQQQQQGSSVVHPQQQDGDSTTLLQGSSATKQQQPPHHEAALIPIHLRLCFNGIYVHDDFDWDVRLEHHCSPLAMATHIANDLNLAEDSIPIIAVAIVEQIHGITMAHHIDEDDTERTTAAWPVPSHTNINHSAIVSSNHVPKLSSSSSSSKKD
jgi:SNF5 / SMARCB1 / INI1